MANYTIIVQNESTKRHEFLLFSSLPELSENVGHPYTNVWVKSVSVPTPNGHAQFDIQVEDFAVCGTTPTPLANDVLVSTGDYIPVTLTGASPGTKGIVKVVGGGPEFVAPAKTTSVAHSFGISVEPYNPLEYPNIYCGYGKRDDSNKVVPVVVWQAEPSATYTITPNATYYIGTGTFKRGEIVDVSTIGAVSEINFLDAPSPAMTVATITLDVEGQYSAPVFSVPKKIEE